MTPSEWSKEKKLQWKEVPLQIGLLFILDAIGDRFLLTHHSTTTLILFAVAMPVIFILGTLSMSAYLRKTTISKLWQDPAYGKNNKLLAFFIAMYTVYILFSVLNQK